MRRRKKQGLSNAEMTAVEDLAAAVDVRVNGELDRSVRTQLALVKAVRGLREDLANHNDGLARALDRLGKAIELDAETTTAERRERRAHGEVDRLERRTLAEADRLERRATAEADRLERRALIEAVAYLAQTLADRQRLPGVATDIESLLERELGAGAGDIDLALHNRTARPHPSDCETKPYDNGSRPATGRGTTPRRAWFRG